MRGRLEMDGLVCRGDVIDDVMGNELLSKVDVVFEKEYVFEVGRNN